MLACIEHIEVCEELIFNKETTFLGVYKKFLNKGWSERGFGKSSQQNKKLEEIGESLA